MKSKGHLTEKGLQEILKLHKKMNNRKSLLKDLQKLNINVGKKELNSILSNCITCIQIDNKYFSSKNYIDTSYVDEIIGIDLMEIKNKY